MISLSYLLDRLKDVKLEDYLSIFPMTVALLIKPFYKKKYRGTWLICEEPAEARDNGYHFFRYMCKEQPQKKCFYAIKKDSVDYHKVSDFGETIEHGSIQHWLAYFLCEFNISSQKGGKPNAAMCAFMEMNGRFHPRNIFLQHGITINKVRWLFADRSKIDLFITATIDETIFIKDNFGYSKNSIRLTGFPRFDNLHNIENSTRQIIIMPTWRYWFNLNSKNNNDVNSDIGTSDYVYKWVELLKSSNLIKILEDNHLNLLFYLHRNMQSYINYFKDCNSERVIIASWENYDIQDILKNSCMMITDYSSVFFDMVYMKKPILFYQFDKKDFRKFQYDKGYFDYDNNLFGVSKNTLNDLLGALDSIVKNNFTVSHEYLKEHQRIFKYYDSDNSKRVYEALMEISL